MDTCYSILIVEDEDAVRRALSVADDWAKRGYRLIGSAASAEEAMELARIHTPDVILTDIRMGGLTGLDMIERLQEKSLEPAIVLLSGYSEFDYARHAIRLGVFEYLTKPIDSEKLEDAFRRLRRWLSARAAGVDTGRRDGGRLELHRNDFLLALLGRPISEIYARDRFAELKMGVPHGDYCVLTITLGKTPVSAYEKQLRSFWDGMGRHCVIHQGRLAVLFGERPGRRRHNVAGELARLGQYLSDMSVTMTAGVGRFTEKLGQVHTSYLQSLEALALYFYSPADIRYYDDIPPVNREREDSLEADASRIYHEILSCASRLDREGVAAQTEELFALLRSVHPRDVEAVYKSCETLYMLVLTRLESAESAHPDRQGRIAALLREMDTLSTLEDYIRESLMALVDKKRNRIGLDNGDPVARAVTYIEEHIREHLTSSDVAAGIHVSASHLSRVFRQHTGKSLTAHITEQKVELAMQLLRTSRFTVQDIALQLGFSEYRYFCMVFKKQVGKTPLSYRRSCMMRSNTGDSP